MLLTTALTLFHLLVHILAHDIHYVRPNSSSSCPGQPCLTLDQYTEQKNTYFTSGTTFIFLEGNHTLQTSLKLTGVSNLSLTGEENDISVSISSTQYISLSSVTNIFIERLTFKKLTLKLSHSETVYISQSIFSSVEPTSTSAALSSYQSSIAIVNCLFEYNKGGAISVESQTTLTITGTNFTKNVGVSGGAISASESALILRGINISDNVCLGVYCGAVLCCLKCTVNISGNNHFENNSCETGGAISISKGTLNITGVAYFLRNRALMFSTIYLDCSHALIQGKSIEFRENIGGMRIENIRPENHQSDCPGIVGNKETVISANFVNNDNNFAMSEIIHIFGGKNIIFRNLNMTGGTIVANALTIADSSVKFEGVNLFNNSIALNILLYSNVTFSGTSIFCNNNVHALNLQYSSVSFGGYTSFHNNSGSYGAAIKAYSGDISFSGTTIFTNNIATKESDGGALLASSAKITMGGDVNFSFNSARNGGAMWLEKSSLVLLQDTTLNTSYNTATAHGGAIYIEDTVTINQCGIGKIDTHSYCFLEFPNDGKGIFNSYYDYAMSDGSFLYGGLLDKCTVKKSLVKMMDLNDFRYRLFRELRTNSSRQWVTSKSYQLCLCDSNHEDPIECHNKMNVQAHRGKNFTLQIKALGQFDIITPATLATTTDENTRLQYIYQSIRLLPQSCSPLNFSIFSKENATVLKIRHDGLCQDFGNVIVNVTVLPCDETLTQIGDECVCDYEKRLLSVGANCIVGDQMIIIRDAGSNFWVSALYKNNSYKGLILCRKCPTDYCTNGEAISITVDNPDIQCDHNRIGKLCGKCATNHSLLLGSSHCGICSHHYLALLVPFALAGIVLVVFLSCLRLTVATGSINSFILYANFVQANKITFFPPSSVNILTVFIAWLNLDLGFETCFFAGLDAYFQTWLQFAFPLYVWILIGLIIFTSRYSITISKLLGRNPIAVLATLILMSYNKILKIIIETFSSVQLDYPNGKKVSVWLKDANVFYLQSKHLALSVVASVILTFLFLPYTIFLLTGPCLYRMSFRKCFFILRRIKPLLDSYYAPYKNNTRYWTGFLLLVRCALYIVFSYNSLGGINNSLLAIIITFTAIGFISWYLKRIYKKLHNEIIEGSIYLNLIVLSSSTVALDEVNKGALIYTLIGIVFTTMMGVILYQFYLLFISKTAIWLKIEAKVANHFQKPKIITENEVPVDKLEDSSKIVSKTVIDLREPLLDS